MTAAMPSQIEHLPVEGLIPYARNFNPDRWTTEMDIDGPSPAPWLSGYLPDATLRKIAHKMRAQRATGLAPGKRERIIPIQETRP